MIERGFGRIINTTCGIKNEPEQAAYAASKAALEMFTKGLASKLEGTNVMLNITDPNWRRTHLGVQMLLIQLKMRCQVWLMEHL